MSTLPKPVALPTQQVQAYQNQALAGVGNGQLTAAPSAQTIGSAFGRSSGAPTIAGRTSLISEGASNAHAARLSALQRRAQSVSTPQGGSGGGGVHGAPAGPLTGNYKLTAGAASSLARMQADYQKKFGQPLTINSGGRTHEEQSALYNAYKSGRGNLAAAPGTSVHETGNAVDFGGAAHGYGPQQTWLAQNAGRYGWTWAGKNFSQVEPWHFEWRG